MRSFEKLSLRQILLYGFVVLGVVSCAGVLVIHLLLLRSQTILDQQKMILNSYDASYSLKIYTEKLLTERSPKEAYQAWTGATVYAQAQLNRLLGSDLAVDSQHNWYPLWKNLQREIMLIQQKFASSGLDALNKNRKPLLSVLGQAFDTQNQDVFYGEISALVDEVEYAQQFETFLIDELGGLSNRYIYYSNRQLGYIRTTMISVLVFYLLFLCGFSYTLLYLVKRIQNNLLNTQGALTQALEDLKSNQQQLLESRDSMDYLAHHDVLTGLPNRRFVAELLENSIREAKKTRQKIGLLFIDLDRFKEINDSLGHSVGDKVLITIAERIRKIAPPNVTLARIGGDEFTFVCAEVGDNDSQLSRLAEQVIKTISQTMHFQKWQLQVTCSIGISIYPDSAHNAEILLRNADAAMYSAKNQGKNNYQFYTESLTQQTQKRAALEHRLRHVVQQSDFELLYQPQFHLETKAIVGWEALLRCRDTDGQYLFPTEFIPIAEEIGLIHRMTFWVFRTAAKQAVDWHDAGFEMGRIAINLSSSLLMHSRFLEDVRQILTSTGCQPDWIELEITESQLMNYPQDAIALLGELRHMGFSVAVDDFGTGYSSLAVLKTLPINKIKMDKSFLINVPSDQQSCEIVRTMIVMAQALKLEFIAEGVEFTEQAEFLAKAGCQYGQGYLFSKPLSSDQAQMLPVFEVFISNFVDF